MNCKIVSLNESKSYKKLQSVFLPAYLGQMQILSQHAESFVSLRKGKIIIKQSDGKKEIVSINGGECYIKDDSVTVIL